MGRFPFMILFVALLAPLSLVAGATITGTVTDTSGKPLEGVRIDHIGKIVVVARTDLLLKPSPDEVRTDANGSFRVVTDVPAVVIRKPGYQSQRVRLSGDSQLKITLQRIESTSRCKLKVMPALKSKAANDVDYVATWYYIETKDGPQGIISGSGSTYSFGAPADNDVWTSVDYEEVMYESGVVDASGHSTNDKYWRRRGIFGAAAQYCGQTREIAEQLDCVMDRIPIKLGP